MLLQILFLFVISAFAQTYSDAETSDSDTTLMTIKPEKVLLDTMKNHKIYIIHGILGNKAEYKRMRKELHKNGFETTIFTYKSRKTGVMDVSKALYEQIKVENPDSFSLISHSLGGLIARGLLTHSESDPEFPSLNRVVMIAPPNQGTIAGDYMIKRALFRWILGVNLKEVTNDDDSLARKLPVDFNCEVGIIAGIRGKKSGYNPFIGEDNDGEIRPMETKLGTETDFITVKANHLSILRKKETIQQTLDFLKNGTFNH